MQIAICDDEEYHVGLIKSYLDAYKEELPAMKISCYLKGQELVAAARGGIRFDIVFLDMQLKNDTMNGLTVAKKLVETNPNILILVISSYPQYAIHTQRVGSFLFVHKPIKEVSFRHDFEKLLKAYKDKHYKITVKWKAEEAAFDIADIYYIEAYHRHIKIYATNRTFEAVGKLKDYAEKLKPYDFIQVHQGYLVNMAYIQYVGPQDVTLDTGTRVPISTRRRAEVVAEFNQFISGRTL